MAKKIQKPKKEPKPSKTWGIVRFFKSNQFRYTLGVFMLIFSGYLAVAFVSYTFSGKSDQSKLDLPWQDFLFDPSVEVQNIAGKSGAYLSEQFINLGFGFPSFFLILIFFIAALNLFGYKKIRFFKTFLFSFLWMIWASITLALALASSSADQFLYVGGMYGFILSSLLSSLLGTIGAALILMFTLFVLLIVTFKQFIPWLTSVFARKEKYPALATPLSIESSPVLEIADPSISKIITEDNKIKTIIDPDSADDFEIENTVSKKNVEMSIEDMLFSDEPITKKNKTKEPELQVVKPVFDENAEVGNLPLEPFDPTLDLSTYKYPTLDLLDDHASGNAEVSNEELISNKNKIVETLRHYKIEITKIRATIGPTITLYEIVPAPGIRIAKIKNLEDDIALSLSALGIRIIAPIPGRGTIGIEVPNQKPEIVSMRSIIGSKKFQESTAELPIAFGKTISNETFMVDLAKMPHILVAGATGQGKSVGLNAIIISLLYKKHPSQLKFVLVDPKKVELTLYASLEKHFLAKMPDEEDAIITDIQKVKNTLNSVNIEMDNRYDLLKRAHVRNINEYNTKFIGRRLNPEKGHRYLPYIIVVIDEFADLIMTAGKEIELPIARIAQLARAVGIHMIIATQRPSINIITGVIKANFPTRIAFKVASMIDSRTILDTPGANQLIGKGDMLVSTGNTMTRVQCAFVDTPEVERICEFVAEQRGYPTAFLLPDYVGENEGGLAEVDLRNRDEMFDDAARLIVSNQVGSTSMIQRKFSIGYNRAGRLMDQMEAAGIVGPSEGSKARQVLIQDEYSLEQLLNGLK
ncbi:MAG: DNA translocase FtsK 4TM domain-containing protein [Bacteroidota bacterium]|nr:cell division protein FtsK [Odoribacter sp.]MDP3644128.1 DNA translocase FtsK 4TM domain-containing protein [Bacteroidota bacterium]